MAHPFYEKNLFKEYEASNNELVKQLELLIFAAARAESLASGSFELKKLFRFQGKLEQDISYLYKIWPRNSLNTIQIFQRT